MKVSPPPAVGVRGPTVRSMRRRPAACGSILVFLGLFILLRQDRTVINLEAADDTDEPRTSTKTQALSHSYDDASVKSKDKQKGIIENDSLPTAPTSGRQEDLIGLWWCVCRWYQSRTEHRLPLVEERHPDLAWGKGVWEEGQNRSHFRSHYPLLSPQSIWDNAADHIYQRGGTGWEIPEAYDTSEERTNQIKNGDVIFINQAWVSWIVDVAPDVQATANITLVLFDGDASFCEGTNQDTLRSLDFVSRIFVTNACPHPKVTPLPLGLMDNLEFPTTSETWTIHGDESRVANLLMEGAMYENKKGVYCDMNLNNNVDERSDALDACNHLKETTDDDEYKVDMGSLASENVRRSWKEYIRDLSRHRFVVSPQGGGFDCHRTWETLLVGSIPIVKHVEGMDVLFEGLPVLIVASWSDVTKELLDEWWETFVTNSHRAWQFDKLFAPYWVDQVRGTTTHSKELYRYADPGGISW